MIVRKFIKKFSSLFFILVLAAVLLFFLDVYNVLDFPRNIFYSFSSPIQKGFISAAKTISSSFNFLISLKNLSSENKNLKTTNTRLLAENIYFRDIVQENKILKEQLGINSNGKFTAVSAKLTGRDPLEFGSFFWIDKGEFSGVKINMPVIAAGIYSDDFNGEGGFLLGRITEVEQKSSKVLALTNFDSKVNAIIRREKKEIVGGIVRGGYGFNLVMDLVPTQNRIFEGDIALTSGKDGLYPEGLVIGSVAEIINKDNQIFQKVKVSPIINMNELDTVFIISL